MNLKPFAADPQKSLGRQFKEAPSKLRNDFQRDRDRIIHSGALLGDWNIKHKYL